MTANPYSYHTLLYPFIYVQNQGQIHSDKQSEAFINYAHVVESWAAVDVDLKWKLENMNFSDDAKLPKEVQRLKYATRQYFNPATRKALALGKGDDANSTTRRYTLVHHGTELQDWHYIIYAEGKQLDLRINAIKLMLFNVGIGVLIYELEYYPVEQAEDDPNPWQTIKKINEYARRVYPPYIGCNMMADDIRIMCGKNLIADCNGNDQINQWYFVNHADHVIDTVSKFLPTGQCSENMHMRKRELRPAIDDRMFVCCLVADSNQQDRLLGENGNYMYSQSWESAQDLYAFVNIDKSTGDCSAQNREKLYDDLKEQLYLRWGDWGTCYGITPHSFVCLTGDPKYTQLSVINPFLTMYVDLAILLIVQRAALLMFDERTTRAITMQDDKDAENNDTAEKLWGIDLAFHRFESELLLEEVTPQIQGIELYRMLQKHMNIDRLNANVQTQVTHLYEIERLRKMRLDKEREKAEQRITEKIREKNRRYRLLAAAALTGFESMQTLSLFSISGWSLVGLGVLFAVCVYFITAKIDRDD